MKRNRIWVVLVCLCLLFGALFAFSSGQYKSADPGIAADNAANFAVLLADLVKACETPSTEDDRMIDADLKAIRSVRAEDYETAKAIADHWRSVYLDSDYRLYVHDGGERAGELADAGIPDSAAHAFVVLGYQLSNGEMQPELICRCEAAAAAARSFPNTILVCSGGATGADNPEKHTEAALMKEYLSERCGIDAARIYIDERAMTTEENAINTLEILRERGVRSMTIVTSDYHQRWGQAVYNAAAEICRRQYGFSVRIIGNYCCRIAPSSAAYARGDRIAVMQIAGILELPNEVKKALPGMWSGA